jgi:uncharacterized protein YukE
MSGDGGDPYRDPWQHQRGEAGDAQWLRDQIQQGVPLMAQLGNDPEQLDQLSKKFEQEAQQIQQATQQISSQVNSVWWKGPDADRFRNEWEGQFAAQLKKIAEALRQTGTIVRKQAQQQRQTSSA